MTRLDVGLVSLAVTLIVGCGDDDGVSVLDTSVRDTGAADASVPDAGADDAGSHCAPGEPECRTVARIETSLGVIRVELDAEHAPITVANFVQYADDGFYDGTIFHRIIGGFVIQGGGYEPGMRLKETRAPIVLETDPALRHVDGAISMARTMVRDSATSQFYLCDGAQPGLDDEYAAFGVTIEGLDVVHDIAAVETTPSDQPVADVLIRSLRIE